jgi:GNAT superfamily N-acetyltransferase
LPAVKIKIRKGNKRDLPEVLRHIRELAAYERAPDEVTVTLKELEQDGFGKSPLFEFFVAELDGKVCGMALYYVKFSTWKGKCFFLEDIIVEEKFRGHGIGKRLFEAVIAETKRRKMKRLEWQVLDWNEPAISFYEKYNSQILKEWLNFRLTEEQIQRFG